MPVPVANTSPPFNIVRASHAVWGVTDLDYARGFYVDLLGYVCEDDTGDALYLRGMEERNHHSLVLAKADEPVVYRIAFKVAAEADLDRAEAFYASAGCRTAFVERHAQGRTLHVDDPFGIPLEFYYEMERRGTCCCRSTTGTGAPISSVSTISIFSRTT